MGPLAAIEPVVEGACSALVRGRGLRPLSISLDDDVTEPVDKLLLLLLNRPEEEVIWELVGWMIVLFLLGILPLDGIELVVLPASKTLSTRLTSLIDEDDLTEDVLFLLEVAGRVDLDVVVVLPD